MKSILSIFFLAFYLSTTAQDVRYKATRLTQKVSVPLRAATLTEGSPVASLTNDEKNVFLQKNIPSVISKSGMAPAHFDNFNISFGDDEIALTSGTFTSNTKTQSFGGTIKAAAPNGSRVIFQPGSKAPLDFNAELKYTFEFDTKKRTLSVPITGSPYNISSVSNKWVNVSFSSSIKNHILFLNDTSNITEHPFTFEALVSYNYLFNSFLINTEIDKRILFSFGAGLARFTNYSEFNEINLRKGIFSSTQFSETEVISGRVNNSYKITTGTVIRAAAYKPLTDPFSLSALHAGITANSFGLGSSNHLLNGTAGIYFSRWAVENEQNSGGTQDPIMKEIFSIGLIADFKNLQNASQNEYLKNNFRIMVTAQIPLQFF